MGGSINAGASFNNRQTFDIERRTTAANANANTNANASYNNRQGNGFDMGRR